MNAMIVLLLLVIALTWIRLVRPGSSQLLGVVVRIEPLTLLARSRMHLGPVLFGLGLGVALLAAGRIPVWAIALPVISGLLLVLIPVRYTLTEQGIRLGYTGFRRWTEFTGVRRAPGGARLIGMRRRLGMHIWLSGARGDDEFLQFLRQTVKNAYKGNRSVIPFPTGRVTPPHLPPPGDESATRMVAGS